MSYALHVLGKPNESLVLQTPGGFVRTDKDLCDLIQLEVLAPGCSVVLPSSGNTLGQNTVLQVKGSSSSSVTLQTQANPVAVMGVSDVWSAAFTISGWEAWKVAGVNFNSTGTALAGFGLMASRNGALNVVYSGVVDVDATKSSAYQISGAVLASLLLVQSGDVTISFPVMPKGFWFSLQVGMLASTVSCVGVGGKVRPLVNGQASLSVPPGAICTFVSDGNDFWLSAGSVNPLWFAPLGQSTIPLATTQSWANLDPVQVRARTLLFHTSPWSGANQCLAQDCFVYMGNTPGNWDVIFDTSSNTLENSLFFVAGTQSQPSTGQQVPVSANSSCSFRLVMVQDPQESSVLDMALVGAVETVPLGG